MRSSLIDYASRPYRGAGRFAYNFARGKLRADPVFRALLERGLLQGRTRILDLGCGPGRASIYLARLGWQVDGVDFVPQAIATARQRARSEPRLWLRRAMPTTASRAASERGE